MTSIACRVTSMDVVRDVGDVDSDVGDVARHADCDALQRPVGALVLLRRPVTTLF